MKPKCKVELCGDVSNGSGFCEGHAPRCEYQFPYEIGYGKDNQCTNPSITPFDDGFPHKCEEHVGLFPGQKDKRHIKFTVEWYPLDGEYLAKCDKYKYVSWLAPTPKEAFDGLYDILKYLGDV